MRLADMVDGARILLVGLAALALVTAGCLGGGGDEAETAGAATGDQAGNEPDAASNGTEPGLEENATDEPSGPTWNVSFTNATVEGTNAVVSFGEPLGSPNNHTFHVVDGARNLTFNFTADDGELYVTIYEPGCSGGSACSHRADTGGLYHQAMGTQGTSGESSWSTQNPQGGEWRVEIYKGDTGTGSVDYTVERAVLEPGESPFR